jgi:hypothetical protein
MKWLLGLLLSLAPFAAQAQDAPLGYFGCMTTSVPYCILKTAGGKLYDFQVTNLSGTALWAFLLDRPTAPSNGTVVATKVYQLSSSGETLGVSWIPNQLLMNTGITIACSTTAPPTLTLSETCLISGETQ